MKRDELTRLLQADAQNTPVPPSLRNAVLDAVQGKETPIMKKKISVAFAFALALVLICSVALAVANQAGILDFAGRYIGSYVPENAADYVQKGDTILENEVFTATIREQYYDGYTTRMVVDFTPKGENVLLVGVDSWEDDSWQSLIHLNHEEYDHNDQRTIQDVLAEYEIGYQCNFHVFGAAEDSIAGGTSDFVLDPETGVLTFYEQTMFDNDQEIRELKLYASATPIYIKDGEFIQDYQQIIRTERALSIASAGQTQAYESVEPVEFPSVGVRVDRLLIEVKPQEIFATIDCTVIDEEAYNKTEHGLWFEFIDPSSTETEAWKQQLSSGLTGSGSVSTVTDGKFQQHETLGLKELYETYTLRAYDAWTKDRYETQTLVMKPVE
ncbi:MAG: hypothetical protein IJP04_12800 [Clostridia bacterium]|nr:hypothetical protein [Clostridia bacterium]